MDKVKKTAKVVEEIVEKVVDEPVEVVNEVVQKVDKKKAVTAGAAAIEWLTAGKVEKNTVLAIAGLFFGLSSNMGPWEKATVEALEAQEARVNNIEVVQEANQPAVDEAARFFDVEADSVSN